MSEHLHHRGQESGWFRIVLALICAGEGIAVFFGLKDLMLPGTLAAGTIPIVTAFVVAGAFFMIWDHLCRSVPTYRSAGRRTAGIALGTVLMLATIAASSWFIAAAIGGDAAIRVHQDAFIARVQVELEKATANAKAELPIKTKALEIEAAWRGESKREGKHGTQSGKAGDGPVTMLYANVAESMLKLARVLDNKRLEAEEGQKKLVALIKDMKQAANPREFNQRAVEAAALLSKLDGISGVADAHNFGIVNIDLKTDIRVQIDQLTDELRRTAKEADDKRRKLEPPFYAPMSGAVAIIEYPSASPGAWIVGVAIDLVPFLVLLLLVLNHAEARESKSNDLPRVVNFPAGAE